MNKLAFAVLVLTLSAGAGGLRELPRQTAFAEAGAVAKVEGRVSCSPMIVDVKGKRHTFLKGVLEFGSKTISIRNSPQDWNPQCMTITVDGRRRPRPKRVYIHRGGRPSGRSRF